LIRPVAKLRVELEHRRTVGRQVPLLAGVALGRRARWPSLTSFVSPSQIAYQRDEDAGFLRCARERGRLLTGPHACDGFGIHTHAVPHRLRYHGADDCGDAF
jgi:hypothetical protein